MNVADTIASIVVVIVCAAPVWLAFVYEPQVTGRARGIRASDWLIAARILFSEKYQGRGR